MSGPLPYDALEEHLKKITYKPSWKFVLEPHGYSHDLFLIVAFRTIDTYHDESLFAPNVSSKEIDLHKEVKIGMRHRLRGPFLDIEQFNRAILDAIDKCERHETREWFKVDGFMKYDPHKGPR